MEYKPGIEELRTLSPDLDQSFLEEHLESLDSSYFAAFDKESVIRHAELLSQLTPEQPWKYIISQREDGNIDCTILAYDYPAVFSMITGLFSATGFDIISGNIYTYSRMRSKEQQHRSIPGKRRRRSRTSVKPTRKIIDRFTGKEMENISFETWKSRFTETMDDLFHTLGDGKKENIERARLKVSEMVVQALSHYQLDESTMLYPVELGEFEIGEKATRLLIKAEDTPFFLYTLSNALSLHDISIEHVNILTRGNKVEDTLEISDPSGNPVKDPEKLKRIKLSVLFTKQFTFFLGKAPDPYKAFKRFEDMIQDLENSSSQGFLDTFLKEPTLLQDLARLLGASDFLWSDFLHNQYEAILPLLEEGGEGREFSHPSIELPELLARELQSCETRDDERRILNEFKDREIYLIDLDHILSKNLDFQFLSNKLTALAETVVGTAVSLSRKHLKRRFGTPVTVAGLDATYAVMGLGKLGGAALGYASDIELLFVYSDNGLTDGDEQISNSEYFERLFKESVGMIQTKREGIFHIDLRLRPFGTKGPLACSLENFIRYFGKGGSAHSYERLALIRMRAIGGDHALGQRIERIRDEIIYASEDFDLAQLKDLRQKQFTEKSLPGKLNAKFSPGGLVDLEYTVQILQCIHGKNNTDIRTPRIHVALEELAKAGVMSTKDARELTDTYYFFRRLINGLRMLRGNAKDLFLPLLESEEYLHLARRIGYTEEESRITPSKQLHLEFESRAATIRTFVESHLGRDSLPGPPVGNAADLVLSSAIQEDLKEKILESVGITNTTRAYTNIRTLAGTGERKNLFARLSVLAWDVLKTTPDPDMALNNWERFIQSGIDSETHYRELLFQPKRLEILLEIFAGSQFLADTLVSHPEFFEWVTDPGHLHTIRLRSAIEQDIERILLGTVGHKEWFEGLRRLRKREILRIGTRDICLKKPIHEIVEELSNLADAIVRKAVAREWEETGEGISDLTDSLVIFAFGKLGGGELNYSSDIDLLGVSIPGPDWQVGDEKTLYQVMERLRKDLSERTEDGYVYRVDLRLRPYGRSGPIVTSKQRLLTYFREEAALWEYQALLRLRPVAGSVDEGERITEELRQLLLREWNREEVVTSIDNLRSQAVRASNLSVLPGTDIKNGEGGLRDIEFLVQGLQLIHIKDNPELMTGNTMAGIELLREAGLLPDEIADSLKESYLYLRRLEHFIQIYDDRQTHTLPQSVQERKALHKRLEGDRAAGVDLLEKIEGMMASVRRIYETYLIHTV